MAKLGALPAIDIIDGMKGVIDYYVHDGVPCARSWPRKPTGARSPAVQEGWIPFAFATAAWNYLTPSVRDAYTAMAVGTPMTPRDLMTSGFMTDIIINTG